MIQSAQAEIQLGLIDLPLGFSIDIYAENAQNARQMKSVRFSQAVIVPAKFGPLPMLMVLCWCRMTGPM